MNNYSLKMTAFGLLFLILGIFMTINAVRLIISAKNGRRVIATVVDVIQKRHIERKHRVRYYYIHTYEYYDNLEPKLYQSRERESTQRPIGSEETLYISADGFIIEKITCVKLLVIGLVFLAFGVFFIINAFVQ
ncbi:MAG: hypothetical protein K2N72_09475 [Oscillospiraceae bacterium]|nr:hypothetical protein [Oscillospiraceae bacterium]